VVIIKAALLSNYNYRVYVHSKLPSYKILSRLRDAVDKVLREGKCGFGKGKGCVSQIFHLRLKIKKCLSYEKPLVPSFIDYEQVFDSVDRRACVSNIWF